MRSCVHAREKLSHISAQYLQDKQSARWSTTTCLLWFLIQSTSTSRLQWFLQRLHLSCSSRIFAHRQMSWSSFLRIWTLSKQPRWNWPLRQSLRLLTQPIAAKLLQSTRVWSMSKLLVLLSGTAWPTNCWINSRSSQTLRLSTMVSMLLMLPSLHLLIARTLHLACQPSLSLLGPTWPSSLHAW